MSTLVEEPVVLAVGVRVEGVECVCAGTLLLLRELGWRVAVAGLTRANSDPCNVQPQSAAPNCSAILDAEYHCLDCPEFTISCRDELCRRVTAMIRAVRPAVVLTHGSRDATPEQEATSLIVRQACLAAPAKGYETRDIPGSADPTARIAHVYYLDPLELIDALGHPVEPSLIVDISGTIEAKSKMLAGHVGWAAWMSGRPDVGEYLEEVRTWARQRGEKVGHRFGEGYRLLVGPPYPRDDLLKQVLGPLACSVE